MQDISSQPGIEPKPSALEAWSLNHRTTKEVPVHSLREDRMFSTFTWILWDAAVSFEQIAFCPRWFSLSFVIEKPKSLLIIKCRGTNSLRSFVTGIGKMVFRGAAASVMTSIQCGFHGETRSSVNSGTCIPRTVEIFTLPKDNLAARSLGTLKHVFIHH